MSLSAALRLAEAIADHFAAGSASPLRLSGAIDQTPKSTTFRVLAGASIAYGLTDGGYNAHQISLTQLGRRIVKPLADGDDAVAKREALLKPKVIKAFLTSYSGNSLPKDSIAMNVLEDLGVPKGKTAAVLKLIIDGASALGLLSERKGKLFVDLEGVAVVPPTEDNDAANDDGDSVNDRNENGYQGHARQPPPSLPLRATAPKDNPAFMKRVFITHGKNKAFLDPIKDVLNFGEMVAVVSVERESVSKPVPDKVWMTCVAVAPPSSTLRTRR